MEIAAWTAIGASLGLIAKGVSADKPLTQQDAQAKLDEVLAQLKKAREDLAAQEKEIKDKAKAAAEQEETVAEVTGVLKKRLGPATAPPADITAAATVWSRAKADDIKQFAENRLAELRTPAAVNAIPVPISAANTAGEEMVAVVSQPPAEEQQQGQQEASLFDSATGTAPNLPAQPGEPKVGGAVATNREALYESLKNNWSEYSEIARKSLETFHSRFVNAWKLDNPGRELPAEEMLVPFANKVAEELNQIPIDRAKREAEDKQKENEEPPLNEFGTWPQGYTSGEFSSEQPAETETPTEPTATSLFYGPRAAEARRERGLTDTQEIDTFIRKETPDVIKRAEAAVKNLSAADKKITQATKLVPEPKLFKGGCLLITVTAKTFLDGIFDTTASLKENLETLKASFKEYEKETKGVKVFDKSFQISDAEMEAKIAATIPLAEITKRDEKIANVKALVEASKAASSAEEARKELEREKVAADEWLRNWASGSQPPPPPPSNEGGQTGGAFQKLIDLKFKIDGAIVEIRKDIRAAAEFVMETDALVERIRALPKQDVLSDVQQAVEERECNTLKEEVETPPVAKGIAQQRGLDVFGPGKTLNTAVPLSEATAAKQDEAIARLPEQIALLNEQTAAIERTPSQMYIANNPINDQPTTGEAQTSPFFRGVQEVQDWFNTVWAFSSREDRTKLETQRKEAMATLESAMTPSQRERARKKLAEKRKNKIGGEELTEEQKLAEKLYVGLLEGASRKRTLKNRRGGKQTQNGRGTRRGKNRSDRSHPNSRRRT
jgi:hypothetical protein